MLAVAFRDLMTADQGFQGPNENRQEFFKDVIEIAAKVCDP
jgi:hypothetical protein